jgi:hypothetical protein
VHEDLKAAKTSDNYSEAKFQEIIENSYNPLGA